MKTFDAKDCSPSCCPMCKSEEIEWGDIQYDDERMSQDFDCLNCDANGHIVFEIKFIGIDVMNEGDNDEN